MSWKIINELGEKRAAAFAAAATIRSNVAKEDRDMTGEEKGTHDKAMADVTRYGAQIEAETRAQSIGEGFAPASKGNVGRGDTLAALGVSREEARSYNLLRAIRNVVEHKPIDGFEGELSQEIARRSGKAPTGFYMPIDLPMTMRAFDTAAATGAVQTVIDNSIIDMLRVKTIAGQLGVNYLPGLIGAFSLPRQSGGGTAYWIPTEGGNPTESAPALDQVSFTEKTVGAYTDITRKTLNQTGLNATQFVQNDLALAIGTEIDRVIFAGNSAASSGQPNGILSTAAVPTIAMGTNGTAMTRAKILEGEKTLAEGNASGNYKFVTTPANRAKMKSIDKGTDTGRYLWADDNSVEGYPALASNQLPKNLTKGSATAVCSAGILGDFSEVIVGMWGGLDITVDPFTLSKSGGIRVVALQSVDVQLRHPASFVRYLDILTA